MHKKIFFATLFLLILSIPVLCMASAKPIEIYINGEKIESDVAPIIVNDRTLAPVRVISENLGAEVYWDNDNRQVQIITSSKTIILKIDDVKALVNGQEVVLDVPAKIVNDRTLVPLRFLSESLGADVSWDNDLRRVIINRADAKVVDLAYEVIEGKPTVVITGDSPLEYSAVEIQDDRRLAIDVKGRLDTQNNALYVYDSCLEKAIAGEISIEPPITRIVLELSSNAAYKTYSSPDKKSIFVSFTYFDNILEDLTFENKKRQFIAEITTTNAANADYFFLSNPDRLVLDIKNIGLSEIDIPHVPDNNFVKDVRIGQFADDTVRVVFDLKNDTSYQVFQADNVFSVVFSQPFTIEDVKVTSQGDVSLVEILSSDEVFYELKDDTYKKQLKVIVPGAAIGKNLLDRNVIKIADGIIDYIELAKVKDAKTYNLEIVINLSSFVSCEMLSSSPTSNVKFALHKSSSLLPLSNKLIVIDPGHGGSDPGAIVGSVKEKDLNLDIALKLKSLLESNGAKVFMTREDDTFVNLYARAGMANEINADLFISIHHNSATSSATGTETLYYPDPQKKLLAQALQKAIVSHTGFHNRGIVERPGIVVTRETKMPSALVEVGFLTNSNDLALIVTDEFKQKVAQGILQGIVDYLCGSVN
ncbi:N-acetylmuramoyl-L-alanine amidase [Tepidanaerobacter sp. GT38]|uniref:N-acetylmuramoyl-L-alanine amidase n=1 Tax=Tepidanaerobacter sp. GT38 TaxID=2722793 RepID=UPI001F0164B5|nr:N-acetylmuramoyl-L-alanine amidase [Tepidanaerobacter sp. GT38]MCG1011088.1 N-acetylmuramoyl-L-alanine amidase [Tepidanaerobacter sp. GT38]